MSTRSDPLAHHVDPVLASFLAPLKPFHRERRTWPNGFDLDMASYLHNEEPPVEFVTSVRAVVVTSQGVAALHNPDGFHILPGGRREYGESMLETLRREVREETRCSIQEPVLLGFVHINIVSPQPEDYPYPYPDLIQTVYVAEGLQESPEGSDPGGWEQAVEFVAAAELKQRTLRENERIYLEEGLRIIEDT